jgi:L-Ala-D/L-Glu epimerase
MPGAMPTLNRAEALHVAVPLKRPFETARGVIGVRNSWILRLVAVDGAEGLGEIALDPIASAPDEEVIGRVVREMVGALGNGRRPLRPHASIAPSIARAAMAGFDEALAALDRRAAAHRAPELRISVAVNATLDIETADQTAEDAARAVAGGFTCLKLKVGAESREALVERVGAVRAAVGPWIALRLDANCSWDHTMAAEHLADLAAFDLEYVEQPLPATDLAGHAALRRNSPVPIALDESVGSEAEAADILVARAADFLVLKPARVGGPEAVRRIAAEAAAVGVPVVLSTFFETGVGTSAAVRAAADLPSVGPERAHGLATAGLLVHDLLETSAVVSAGRIELPEHIAIDEGALRRYTVERVAWNR